MLSGACFRAGCSCRTDRRTTADSMNAVCSLLSSRLQLLHRRPNNCRQHECCLRPLSDRLEHLALRQVEHRVVQLAQTLFGERAAVRALEVLEHPLLAREVDEADAVLILV